MENKEILTQLIRTRRSVYPRQMSGGRISDDTVTEMLENANWAPTHKLTEPWRFKIYRKEALNRLVDFQESLFLEKNPGLPADDKKRLKYAEVKEKVSHILAIVVHFEPLAGLPEAEEICAVAAAAQNFWLTVHSYGYGGYWSTGNGTFDPRMASWMGLKENERLLGYFYLGIPGEPLQPGRRRPLESKISWE